jgi:cold shock CspA family protein
VVYRERRYEVRDLERGDVVSIDVDEDSRDRRYARTVRVERSVRDGDGRVDGGRLERFDGRVVWVDLDRGQFGLEAGRGGSYVVTVPYRSRDSTLSRFRRLRRGDRVRFDGESYSRGRIELERFV